MSFDKGPLTPAQWQALQQLTEGINAEQILWASGYLAGFDAGRKPLSEPKPKAPQATVLYGSQTGNAARLAENLHRRLIEAGAASRLFAMDAYKPAQLKQESMLLAVASTYGEGEPPDNAKSFYEFLYSPKAPRLEGLRFAVLALGDSSYEHFCKTGRDIDERFQALGASPLQPRADCDVDFEALAEQWINQLIPRLASGEAPKLSEVFRAAGTTHSRANPFPARLLENLRLSGRESSKEVRHIELSLEGSGLSYEPGDSLAVKPLNWPQRVEEILETLRFDAESSVVLPGTAEKPLRQALLEDLEITTLSRPFLEKYAHLAQSGGLSDLLKEENAANFRDFCRGREIIDVLRRYPVAGIGAGQFAGLLRRLQPRQYSIASSLKANPDEAHLTVAVVRYESHGLSRQGVASAFLADRIQQDGRVDVYVESSPNFRLPDDPGAAIIMVGPGTGVAPFRAFMQEREAQGAPGKNWLFFGDRHFQTDFLYQREWLEYRRLGLLSRIDVAFSRDTEKKVYVQHKMLENGGQLYAWLEEGAYFYVCGDAKRMAPDVHEALITVVARESGLGREHALDYVKALQADKRYRRDIY